MLHKVAVNPELANTEPLLLEEIEEKSVSEPLALSQLIGP